MLKIITGGLTLKKIKIKGLIYFSAVAIIAGTSPVISVLAAPEAQFVQAGFKTAKINKAIFETPIDSKIIPQNSISETIKEEIKNEIISELKLDMKISSEKKQLISPLVDYTSLDVPENNHFKSYMDYRMITDETSQQYKLQSEKAYTDEKTGIRMVDGRYCIAVGSYYYQHMTIGTYVDVILENGLILPCVYAEAKSDADTDEETHRQHTIDKSVIEFVVDTDIVTDLFPETVFSGNMEEITMLNIPIFSGKISEIRISNY